VGPPGDVSTAVVIVGGVREEVLVGVPKDARVRVHSGSLVERAETLRDPERVGDGARAGDGIAGVPTAEHEGVDGVRRGAHGAGGEQSPGTGTTKKTFLASVGKPFFSPGSRN
jgi:hypothetical protein